MKKSIAMKWVKALRSGKYKQTRGKLRGQRGYCCLGVLCDIYDNKQWEKADEPFHDESTAFVFGDAGEETTLPNEVQKWAGIKTDDGRHEKIGTRHDFDSRGSLVTLNDKQKWGFKKIAKFIEKNYRGL